MVIWFIHPRGTTLTFKTTLTSNKHTNARDPLTSPTARYEKAEDLFARLEKVRDHHQSYVVLGTVDIEALVGEALHEVADWEYVARRSFACEHIAPFIYLIVMGTCCMHFYLRGSGSVVRGLNMLFI
jgi:hypothetical protein